MLHLLGRREPNWNIRPSDVKDDLTDGSNRPKWILSAYGPGKNIPASLLEGHEYSPEEIRWRFYEQASKGNQSQADEEATKLWNNCLNAMKEIVENADNVVKFMEISEKKHPNRYDLLEMTGHETRDQLGEKAQLQSNVTAGNTNLGSGSGFGAGLGSTNPFAKPPPAFGQQRSPFISNTFGQPSQPSAFGPTPTFGKPSLGGTGSGQDSTFGQSAVTASTFGQPSQSSAFGKPSQPGSSLGSSFGTSGFGQPTAKNPFAAPSAATGFGQSNQLSSTFGQSSFGQASQLSSAFGQSSALGQSGAFGKPPFGQSGPATQPTSTVFGQTSQASSNPFSQPQQSAASPFGQASQTGPASFGQGQITGASNQRNPFSKPSAGGFGAASGFPSSAPAEQSNPFSKPARSDPPNPFAANLTGPPNPFSRPSQSTSTSAVQHSQSPTTMDSGSGQATSEPVVPVVSTELTAAIAALSAGGPHPLTGKPPAIVHYNEKLGRAPSTFSANKVTSFRGQRVQYVNNIPCVEKIDRKGIERVWFPNGPTAPEVALLNQPTQTGDLQGQDDEYSDQVKEAYATFIEKGRFQDGKVPLVPPKRDWCLYDF